ncbi:glycosyltransferase [Methylocaldum gracile]|jgi:glycosyltransferase involved in cell wall biosynthesis|uniref:glycosyltransferase n=1 Tax=Methylocaldum sp. 0917 TaxID=2485163 RepID=UPI00105B4E16
MKIHQVLQSVDNPSAGPTYSVGALAHHLRLRGHDVTVAALGKDPEEWPHRAQLRTFDGPACRVGMAPTAAVRYLKDEMIRQPGILHGHGVWRIANLFPLFLGARPPVKLVWSPRGMFSPWSWAYKAAVKRPFWYSLQKPALKRVDCFHVTAPLELDDVRRLGFQQPAAIIPNGVDLPDVSDIPKEGKRVVFLSRIHEKKGLHLLIPAWCAIADQYPEWELLIAGKIDSSYGHSMVHLARESGAPRVRFLGEVLGQDKKQLLASARLFVLPTFSENFGIAVAEALAHGTPVITTVETPWTELDARGCGWCIQPDLEALKQVLGLAMGRSDGELDAMGRAGRQWIEEDFGWPKFAGMMEAVYRWLLADEPKPDFVIS